MRIFAEHWVENMKRNRLEKIVRGNSLARSLVREREVQLKGGRSRLTNPRHLELWGGRSGTDRMNYRWGITKVLLQDIFDGLGRSEDDARDA